MDEIASRVLQNKKVSDSYHVLTLGVRERLTIFPGQFVQILCRTPGETTPFLRRPFSVMDIRGRAMDILYKVIGPGTARMSEWRPGDSVSILGPFGNAFSIDDTAVGPALVVAGGTGLGGVHYLVRALKSRGVSVTFVYGVRFRRETAPAVLKSLGVKTEVVVEERSGVVTNRLKKMALERFRNCFVCGPTGMIRATADLVRGRIPMIEVSLEEMMGCGFGICYTCPVKKRTGQGYYRACDEGPVFREEMISL